MNDLVILMRMDLSSDSSLFVPRTGPSESTIQTERLCLLILNVFFLPGGGPLEWGAIELDDYDIASE